MLGALVEVEMFKQRTPLWREAHVEVKMLITPHVWSTLEVEMLKCPALWRDAHFQVKILKTIHFWTTFGRTEVVSHGRCKGLCTLPKVSKTWWFRSSLKSVFVTYLKRICKDACCVAGAVQETHGSGMLGGPGADFLRRAAFWSIRSSGLLRWFCVTGAALRMTWPHFFVAGAVLQTDGMEKSQNALVRGRQFCTRLFICEGSLAQLLRFRCSFSNLQTDTVDR